MSDQLWESELPVGKLAYRMLKAAIEEKQPGVSYALFLLKTDQGSFIRVGASQNFPSDLACPEGIRCEWAFNALLEQELIRFDSGCKYTVTAKGAHFFHDTSEHLAEIALRPLEVRSRSKERFEPERQKVNTNNPSKVTHLTKSEITWYRIGLAALTTVIGLILATLAVIVSSMPEEMKTSLWASWMLG